MVSYAHKITQPTIMLETCIALYVITFKKPPK